MGLIDINIFKLSSGSTDIPRLTIDKNTEGHFEIGEHNGLYGIVTLPLRIANIGGQATTINYIQLFILNNKKRKLTYGFRHKDIDKTIGAGKTFRIDLNKVIFIRGERNKKYISILKKEFKANIMRFMFSVYESALTSKKLFAEVIIITPHKKWTFEVPLIIPIQDSRMFIENFKKAERLDKNFHAANWEELMSFDHTLLETGRRKLIRFTDNLSTKKI